MANEVIGSITYGLKQNKVGAVAGAAIGWFVGGKIPACPLAIRATLAVASMFIGAELQARNKELKKASSEIK